MSARDYTAGLLEEFGYGFGAQDLLTPAAPAAGANLTQKVALAGAYRVLCVVCKLVTDANAANRWIELDYQTDGGFVWCRNGGAPIITASTTVNVCWKLGMGASDFASSGSDLTPICYPLPPFTIPQGDQLKIVVGNIQATDQLSLIGFKVEEITEGPRGYPVGRLPG